MTFPALRKALLAAILIFSATTVPTAAPEPLPLAASTRTEEQRPLALPPPFFRDTKLTLAPRSFFFHRDNYDRSRRTTWAGGGALSYQSGYLHERLALGAVGYLLIRYHVARGILGMAPSQLSSAAKTVLLDHDRLAPPADGWCGQPPLPVDIRTYIHICN